MQEDVMKLILFMILSFPYLIISQERTNLPVSFTDNISYIKKINELDLKITEIPNVDSLHAWEQSLMNSDTIYPDIYGHAYNVSYSLKKYGTWDTLHTGDLLWRINIVCPGAYTINFVFNDLHISKNAHISFYNEDKTYLLGPFTDRINKEHGVFSSHLIHGQSVIIELFVPAEEMDENNFILSKIVYGYEDIITNNNRNIKSTKLLDVGLGASGSCNRDVQCSDGDDFCREKYSVSVIVSPLQNNQDPWHYCSGSLLNNTENDYSSYYLTAFHCLNPGVIGYTKQEVLNQWSFKFGYLREGCNYGGIMPTYVYSGADFRAEWYYSDFLLVEFQTQPQPGENNFRDVYFNGWDKSDNTPNNTTCIHHPRGDVMKISQDYDTPIKVPYLWQVVWNTGTTERGSSGSPLYTNEKKVIGQLYRGTASCSNPNGYDEFGRFALSWNGGGTSDTRLKDWLDPNNKLGTNEHTWDGIKLPNLDYGWIITSGQSFTRYAYDVFKIGSSNTSTFRLESGGEFNMQAGKEIHIRPCTHFESGSEYHGFIEEIDCEDVVMLSNKESDYNPYNCGGSMLKQSIPNTIVDEIASNQISIVPNPFNNQTTITISLSSDNNISLAVYDLLGNKIHEFANNTKFSAGEHNFTFIANNLQSGIFYVNLIGDNFQLSKPILLMK